MSHNHALGIYSSMETVSVTREHYHRKCKVCGKEESLPRAGKIFTGYSLSAEASRDAERRKYAKEILQPTDKRGKRNELFTHAYGDPYKKSEIGRDVEKYRIKDE